MVLGLVNITLGAYCMLMISCLCHTQSMLCKMQLIFIKKLKQELKNSKSKQ